VTGSVTATSSNQTQRFK